MGLFKLDKIVRHIDIIFVPMESLPTAISYFVGSKIFNMKMRETAKRKGYKLNEYGLYDEYGEQIKLKSERELFDKLGIEYLEPEERDK